MCMVKHDNEDDIDVSNYEWMLCCIILSSILLYFYVWKHKICIINEWSSGKILKLNTKKNVTRYFFSLFLLVLPLVLIYNKIIITYAWFQYQGNQCFLIIFYRVFDGNNKRCVLPKSKTMNVLKKNKIEKK